jgi:hypothetical protein
MSPETRIALSYEEMLYEVKQNPFFSNPDVIAYVDDDGTEYTGAELLAICGIENVEV